VKELRFAALRGLPEIAAGADLPALHLEALRRAQIAPQNGVLVLCQKIISKAEGRCINLREVQPGPEAQALAREFAAFDKDARHLEVVLRETRRIVRKGPGVLICETHHGFVCANAGVDLSNTPGDDIAVLLPRDPDASARQLRGALLAGGGAAPLGVVVSDTFGRPWREGLVDVALGCAGLPPLDDLRGGRDMRGRNLSVTTMAVVDALAAGAGLLMRKDAGLPSVWATGLDFAQLKSAAGEAGQGVGATLRDAETDLFR